MNSRSFWLERTRDIMKQGKKGRRFYPIHKNHHEYSPFANGKIISTRSDILKEKDTFSLSPIRLKKPSNVFLKRNNEDVLTYKLIEKETELNLLRELCNEASKKLQKAEKISIIEKNMKNLDSERKSQIKNRPYIDSFVVESPCSGYVPLPDLSKRGRSTPNNRLSFVSEISQANVFSQPKYTKNHPKIVLGNPITGLASIKN